jgi:hypothetical protein
MTRLLVCFPVQTPELLQPLPHGGWIMPVLGGWGRVSMCMQALDSARMHCDMDNHCKASLLYPVAEADSVLNTVFM